MQYGQIVLFLAVCLLIYYIVLIAMDVQKARASKAAEAENNQEEDIDISDEAKKFRAVQIRREEKQKPLASQEEADDKQKPEGKQDQNGKTNGKSNKDTKSDKANGQHPDKTHAETQAGGQQTTDTSPQQDDPQQNNESQAQPTAAPQTQSSRIRREPLMTECIESEILVNEVDNYIENGKGPLCCVVMECEKARASML